MTMTVWQSAVTILVVVLGTMLTRFLPFLCFRRANNRPSLLCIWDRCSPVR